MLSIETRISVPTNIIEIKGNEIVIAGIPLPGTFTFS